MRTSHILLTANSRRNQKAKAQKGFTLIEVLIVVSIAAAMLFGIFTVANRISERQAIAETVDGLNLMAAEARTAFRAQGSFAGATPAVLVNMRIPPVAMITGATITHNLGPGGVIAVAPGGTPPNTLLTFTVPGVPIEMCTRLVTGAEGAFDQVMVGTTIVKAIGGRLDPAALATQCATAGAPIALTIRR